MKKLLIIVFILITFMCSCSVMRQTKEITVPVETIRTEYITSFEYDSIFIHDSIDRYVKGDTVFIYKGHKETEYKFLHDTLIQRDTIPVVINTETITEIEVNKLKWYQKLLMGLGGVSFLILVIIITHKVTKLKIW